MNFTVSAAESLNTAVAGVLGRMAGGVFATLVLAAAVNGLGLVPVLFGGILGYVIIFAPLAKTGTPFTAIRIPTHTHTYI